MTLCAAFYTIGHNGILLRSIIIIEVIYIAPYRKWF